MKYKEFLSLWNKEVKRVKRLMREAGKRGYTFDYEFPETPTRVSPKKLEEFRWETTPTRMYKRATYVEPETGEILTGYQRREQERKKSARKGQRTRARNQWRFEDKHEPRSEADLIGETLRDFFNKIETDSSLIKYAYEDTRFGRLCRAKVESASYLGSLMDYYISSLGKEKYFEILESRAVELNTLMGEFERASQVEQVANVTFRFVSLLTPEVMSMEDNINVTEYSEALAGYTDNE